MPSSLALLRCLVTGLVAGALFCASCASPPVAMDSSTLPGTSWVLTTIQSGDQVQVPAPGAKVPTLRLTQEGVPDYEAWRVVRGHTGCNRFWGHYSDQGEGRMQVSELAQTRMSCSEEVMSIEAALLEALRRVQTFEVDDTSLKLHFETGTIHLIPGSN